MACENPANYLVPQKQFAGATRRRMLSVIPAALFAGWRALAARPNPNASTAAPALPQPQAAQDPAVSTFSCSYVSDAGRWGGAAGLRNRGLF